MLIRFTDDYEASVNAGYSKIAEIQKIIAHKEAFMGAAKELDRLYAHSLVIQALIEEIEYDDNSTPISNETLLHNLNYLINLKIC